MTTTSKNSRSRSRLCIAAVYLMLALLALAIGGESATKPTFASVQTNPEWQSQPSGTSEVLLGVSFTDTNKGYAVGTNGVIRVTANGGNTWSAQASGTSRFLRDVYFSDATHGVIVGESGLILRTTDGTNWSQQPSGTLEHLVHVHFANNSVGMACGQGGVILKTTDGGVTWAPQNSSTGVELPGVFMLDVNTAIAVGFNGTIRRTTNGGTSWGSVSVPGFSSDLRSVHFSGNTGVAVSIGGGILKSTDAGQSWTIVSSGTSNSLYSVQFRDANTVYAVGTATVRSSNDAGSSWAPATTTPFSGDLYSVVFSGANGWAVGQNGLILHAESPATLQFSAASYSANEDVGSISVIVQRSGDTGISTVNYASSDSAGANNCNVLNSGVANSRCDYETTSGTLRFAAGETSKTILIPIIDDVYAEGSEGFTITLSNATGGSLGSPSVATVTINDNEITTGTNPINQAGFFVRLHYIDFFTREPDAPGFAFWTDQITSCGADQACTEIRRINVSAAFFLSVEFQETGYLVYRFYKTSYGNVLGLPVPVRFNEFLPDTQQIGQGVVVGQTGWEQVLENNKVAFAAEFVTRSRFSSAFPGTLTPSQFVDALFTNGGVTPSTTDRSAAINEFGGAANTTNTAARGRALRRVAENSILRTQETNRAFVLMQYFGYMRRNPDDPPEANLNFDGYNFWLGKLNQFNGNFVNAEMVKAFIISGEYKERFGP